MEVARESTEQAMIHVLFAIPELDRGGPDRVAYEIVTKLDRTRFRPSLLVSSPHGYFLSRLPGDVRVDVLGDDRSLRGRYPVLAVLRHIRQSTPDIVFATQRMILTLGLAAPLFPRRTRVVLRQANDLSADFAALVKQSVLKHRVAKQMALASLRRADAVVCQSEAMRKDLGALLGATERLHVIANPVDVDVVAKTATTTVSLRGRPALVSMGRLMPQKGFDILLAAFGHVRSCMPHAHLTIFGDGPDREQLETKTRDLGLVDAVTFAGFTREPLAWLKAADLFVLASRYEGFPNAALESLACGTPVVLTDCPGANAEIVIPGANGRLASAVEPTAVAQALEVAVGELERYDRSRIRQDCHARFSSQRIVEQYEHVLAQVAS